MSVNGRRRPLRSRSAAFFCALAFFGAVSSARATDTPGSVHRFRWHGRIDDMDFYVGRAKSGGDVNRLPQAFTSSHVIKVEFEYVQQIAADGSESWPERHLTWSLEGAAGDDTFAEGCHGEGSLDLGPASSYKTLTDDQRNSLKATCEHKKLAISWRMYGRVESMPPLPEIPGVSELDGNCSYRKEEGTRRTIVWMTPDVEAVVDMDAKPGSEYQKFVPEPGKWVELTVKTVPPFPARFRFVIDSEHTSHFSGYAGNAYVDKWFFKRYQLEHLMKEYTDSSPDLIFDKQYFQGKGWSTVKQDVVETATEQTMAIARVSAMDYGAIGKIRVYVACKCGGQASSQMAGGVWTPAKILVGGKPHDAVSVPLDEDNNLMADALEDYKGDPGRDDDAEPEGDGTKGDGLTAFEEYRGFMVEGYQCSDPWTDEHLRTSPGRKNLFVFAARWTDANWHDDPDWTEEWDLVNEATDEDLENFAVDGFGHVADLSVIPVCRRHLSGVDTVLRKFENWTAASGVLSVPPETRVVNFTIGGHDLWEGPVKFDGQVVHVGSQHGVIVGHDPGTFFPRIGSAHAMAVPAGSAMDMGSPKRTAIVLVARAFPKGELLAVTHELGHAVGIPHHSDSRKDWRIVPGVLDVTPGLSPAQAKGLPLGSAEAEALPDEQLDELLIEPGRACHEGDPSGVYRNGQFAGCLTEWIVRRGQQESGDAQCPMSYYYANVYEPPGVRTTWRWRDTVTDVPDLKPDPDSRREHWWKVDAWGGELLRWNSQFTHWGRNYTKFCASIAGTNENEGAGEANLAGDAGRSEPCIRFIVVNDNASKDPR